MVSGRFEIMFLIGQTCILVYHGVWSGRFENKELECLFRRYILRLQHASITAAVALFVVLTAALATASFVVVQVGFAAKFIKDLFRVLLNCVMPNSILQTFSPIAQYFWGISRGTATRILQNYAKVGSVFFELQIYQKNFAQNQFRECVEISVVDPDRAFQVNPDPNTRF
jgi:hypothetical protein